MQRPRTRPLRAVSIILLAVIMTSTVKICLGKEKLGKHWGPLHGVNVTEAGPGELRLVNGILVKPNEFPSYVWGLNPGGCQMSLIRRRWALTACHCVYDQMGRPIPPGDFKKNMAGSHTKMPNEEGTQLNTGMKLIPHPGFDPRGLVWQNDVALIKFVVPFNLTEKIQPVELAPKDYDGLDCIWTVSHRIHCFDGITPDQCKEDRSNATVKKVDLPMMPNDKCEEYLPYEDFNRSMSFCAGYEGGMKSPCWGDSGSPAYLVKDGKTIQVGLVSGGVECGTAEFPAAAFLRISAYRDWIDETIRMEEELDPTPGGP